MRVHKPSRQIKTTIMTISNYSDLNTYVNDYCNIITGACKGASNTPVHIGHISSSSTVPPLKRITSKPMF